jgi:transcriptional regulator with XRE-family HTH domain
MNKKLNIKAIDSALEKKGYSQADIARLLDVTRAIVSKWLKNEKFPRPKSLLQLGRTLELPFDKMVILEEDEFTPHVAFRKGRRRIANSKDYQAAERMGELLEKVSSELPKDNFFEQVKLRDPQNEYGYIQKYAAKVRKDINIGPADPVKFEQIIEKFLNLNVILIPVLWGEKEKEDNALSVFLPKSQTTWVYLNIDAKVHDFKFWMSHELAHILITLDNSKESEAFMDSFAQALLLPQECAEIAYNRISRCRTAATKINKIFEIAKDFLINPYTVLKSVNGYAKEFGKSEIKPTQAFFSRWHQFNDQDKTVIQVLSKSKEPSPDSYIKLSQEAFGSSFFDILKSYITKTEVSPGFIQNILNVPLLDAKSIYQELK